ncbi:RagB/SusD family nutrient uptake outer membrane protein [Saccharicrinis sp. FJH62]|uniref:RagB/SusD family nutrient uptake outer membrane protein n=1 Tax=Saccharicrinis sp. FJH62 TaxID=3344657 RepID=UPI0035D4DAE6
MKTRQILLISSILTFSLLFGSCTDWLERESKTKLKEDMVFTSEALINSFLANIYSRLPDIGSLDGDINTISTITDESMNGGKSAGTNDWENYSYSYLTYYDYGLLKDVNYFIQNLPDDATNLSGDKVDYYLAEGRFLRAYVYFELVKRMGGVPLITEYIRYENGADMTEFRRPRNTEDEIYTFIIDELTEIESVFKLGNNRFKNRASEGACLAVKARAALYAATLAKYNSTMSTPVRLDGGEVGIPAARADHYFQLSLDACQQIMDLPEGYDLYKNGSDPEGNFAELFIAKDDQNPEAIFVEDFDISGKTHGFTYNNIARSLRYLSGGGSYINPSLNLVEAFETLDGNTEKLKDREIPGDESNSYVYYANVGDIFNDRDPRLSGTLMLPGSSFNGNNLDIQAGLAVWNGADYDFVERPSFASESNSTYTDPSTNETYIRTGEDGPHNETEVSRTGFYIRKFIEAGEEAGLGRSSVAFVRYRFGEVLLNAAEAAFELGETDDALIYINRLRERAGIALLDEISLDRIRHERRVELAFEGHRLFDLIRWRKAHELFNGQMDNPDAVISGLWPYKVIRPGHETHEKYIFVRKDIAPEFLRARYFRVGNYYNAFPVSALNANPLLIKNPFQN